MRWELDESVSITTKGPDCGLHNCHPSEQSKSTQQFKVKETKNIIKKKKKKKNPL